VKSESTKPTEAGRRMRVAVMAAVLLLALAVIVQQTAPWDFAGASRAMSTAGNATEPGSWTYLKEQKPAFSLEQTAFSGAPTAHSAYARTDGTRTDWVGAGSLAMAAPDVSIMVTRFAGPTPVRGSVVETLRDFSELRLAEPQFHAMHYALATRLGALLAVTFDVSADGMPKHCVGFRTPGRITLFVEGFVCARDAAAVTPQNAACLIDRIRLVRSADREVVKASPATGESNGCGATTVDSRSEDSL
jgi:hypothetical protein